MKSDVFSEDRWGESTGKGYLLEIVRNAMACQFEVLLHPGNPTDGPEFAYQALDSITYLEDQWSVYKPTSELSMLNARGAEGPVVVSQSTKQLVALALEVHRRTQGAFDATSHKLSQAWGFYRREGKMPTDQEIALALEGMGSQHIALDRLASTVYFRKPVELNPGGIGKGLAIDMAGTALDGNGVRHYAFHGGKSSIRCRGTQDLRWLPANASLVEVPKERIVESSVSLSGQTFDAPAARDGSSIDFNAHVNNDVNPSLKHETSVDGRSDETIEPWGWKVNVRHPEQSERVLGTLLLQNQSLGTSGPANQFFYFKGKRFGHIIDPRTGWPAEGMLSVTVLHPDAGWADALATGLYVMGIDKAITYCEDNPDTAMLAILPGQRAGQVEIVTCNMTKGQWRPS